MRCKLSLIYGKMGNRVRRVGLYLLNHEAPFVKPVTSQAVHPDSTEVLLPITGKDFGAAVRNTCLNYLGLCTQRA